MTTYLGKARQRLARAGKLVLIELGAQQQTAHCQQLQLAVRQRVHGTRFEEAIQEDDRVRKGRDGYAERLVHAVEPVRGRPPVSIPELGFPFLPGAAPVPVPLHHAQPVDLVLLCGASVPRVLFRGRRGAVQSAHLFSHWARAGGGRRAVPNVGANFFPRQRSVNTSFGTTSARNEYRPLCFPPFAPRVGAVFLAVGLSRGGEHMRGAHPYAPCARHAVPTVSSSARRSRTFPSARSNCRAAVMNSASTGSTRS